MFDKLRQKIKHAVIENALRKINSMAGDLSVNGYPDDASDIRVILGRVGLKENEKLPEADKYKLLPKDSFTYQTKAKSIVNKLRGQKQNGKLTFRYMAMDATGRETQGQVKAKSQTEALKAIRMKGLFPTWINDITNLNEKVRGE
jgi:hypothetical protein